MTQVAVPHKISSFIKSVRPVPEGVEVVLVLPPSACQVHAGRLSGTSQEGVVLLEQEKLK